MADVAFARIQSTQNQADPMKVFLADLDQIPGGFKQKSLDGSTQERMLCVKSRSKKFQQDAEASGVQNRSRGCGRQSQRKVQQTHRVPWDA